MADATTELRQIAGGFIGIARSLRLLSVNAHAASESIVSDLTAVKDAASAAGEQLVATRALWNAASSKPSGTSGAAQPASSDGMLSQLVEAAAIKTATGGL
jgi:hypothetical protein